MADVREYSVKLSQVDDENWRIDWGDNSDIVPGSAFFDQQIRDDMLIHSLRLRLAIYGMSDPTADVVVRSIADAGGIQTPRGPVFVARITRDQNGDFRIWYDYTSGDPSYSLGFSPDELSETPRSAEHLAWQIGAFLRFKGIKSLDPQAIAVIESRTFKGF